MNPLKELAAHGQSVWLDYLRRQMLNDGGLERLIENDGVVGLTSNPTIFEKALGGSEYDASLRRHAADPDLDDGAVFERIAVEDIRRATEILEPVYRRTEHLDGYVSLEVSPLLANDTQDTIAEARRLWGEVGRPNLMIKVPGTAAGVPAIRQLISEGINVNVTLLFARNAYEAVADAYLSGLEARAAKADIRTVAGVASFFVSRIDTAMDKKIEERLSTAEGERAAALRSLQGKVAIANAKLAYAVYRRIIESERWLKLASKGARPQRLLWASTGTKNPAYGDVLYVEELIGKDTVDTMPVATLDAFRDHGRVRDSLTEDLTGAQRVIDVVRELGLDLDGTTDTLVTDGVRLFAESFNKLLAAVDDKRASLMHH